MNTENWRGRKKEIMEETERGGGESVAAKWRGKRSSERRSRTRREWNNEMRRNKEKKKRGGKERTYITKSEEMQRR